MKNNLLKLSAAMVLVTVSSSFAQFNLDGQLIQRAEYRNGFGKLLNQGEESAGFIGQRARLAANYQKDNLSIHVSIQDVRTWGSAPQTKTTDGYLSVYEAYAQIKTSENWNVKLGRQELNYDNFRFLGNLDWALQGRSHDFALAKYEKDKVKFHFGAGYNQDGEKLSGNVFATPNQYKTAQFARYEKFTDAFSYSLLFWNDGRQFAAKNLAGDVIYETVRYRQTFGIPTLKYQKGKTTIAAFYYHQLGKDVNAKEINAYDVSLELSRKMDLNAEKGSALYVTVGGEIISGTATTEKTKNNSFLPLYGTNHRHNGYMDYFYVGGRYENGVGLQDLYLLTKYDVNTKTFVSLNAHYFTTQATVTNTLGEKLAKDLGVELDATVGYVYSNAISFQVGYSQFFAQDTFKYLQGVANARNTQNWAYLMLVYRPTMKNKFIGLKF